MNKYMCGIFISKLVGMFDLSFLIKHLFLSSGKFAKFNLDFIYYSLTQTKLVEYFLDVEH